MRTQRYWMAGTIAWLFVLFNVERIHEPINLASFVYLLASLAGVALVLSRRARQAPLYWTIPVAVVGLVVVKAWLGYRIGLDNLPLTLAEAFAVGFTMYLAAQVGRTSDSMHEELLQLLTMSHGRSLPDLAGIEPLLQREMSRARRFEHPITLVTFRVAEGSGPTTSIIHKLEQELISCYREGCVAEVLQAQTKASDLLARENGRFLLVLPETEPTNAQIMIDRVRQTCHTALGLELHAEAVGFPGDELTLQGMLERGARHLHRARHGDSLGQPIPAPA